MTWGKIRNMTREDKITLAQGVQMTCYADGVLPLFRAERERAYDNLRKASRAASRKAPLDPDTSALVCQAYDWCSSVWLTLNRPAIEKSLQELRALPPEKV